jgi:hypothetical protein
MLWQCFSKQWWRRHSEPRVFEGEEGVPNKITKLMNKNKMEAVVAWYHERQDSVDDLDSDDPEIDGDAPAGGRRRRDCLGVLACLRACCHFVRVDRHVAQLRQTIKEVKEELTKKEERPCGLQNRRAPIKVLL